MAGEVENLWPEDFGEMASQTPVAILREQATALGQRTSNLVVGRVHPGGFSGNKFTYALVLYSMSLGYQLQLLQIRHEINLYPVEILTEDGEASPIADSPETLKMRLKAVFSRESTKRKIASLIAQSKQL